MPKMMLLAAAWLSFWLTAQLAPADDLREDRIARLIAEMSREEKIGQTALRGMSSSKKGELTDEMKAAVRAGRIGAFLNVTEKDQVEELQRIAVKESPHHIPLLFGAT